MTYRQRDEENIGARFILAVSSSHCEESNEIPHSSKNNANEVRSKGDFYVRNIRWMKFIWIFDTGTTSITNAGFTGG